MRISDWSSDVCSSDLSILEKLPGGAQMQAQLKNVDTEKQVKRTIAIISSMTRQERRFPDLIKASRKRRIAAGAGVEVQQVNQLMRQFDTTRRSEEHTSESRH